MHVDSMSSSMLKFTENFGGGSSSFQDIILSKVNETSSIFKPVSGDDIDQIGKMIAIFAAALSSVVRQVVNGVSAKLDSRLRGVVCL